MAASQKDNDSFRFILAKWIFTPLSGVLLTDWLRILRQYGTSIPPRYWIRNLFTLFMGTVNSVVAVKEPDKWKLEQYKVKKPIFIIGHHRSGTTHLWQLISVDQNFIYPTVTETIFPHTMLSMEKLTNKLAELFSPRKRPQDNVKSSSGSPMGEEWAMCSSTFLSTHMARHFPEKREFFKKYLAMKNVDDSDRKKWKEAMDRFARKLLVRYGNDKTLLFKAPPNTAKIKLILELYPDARFIHIYRNPFRVFQSAMHMEMKSLPLCAYQDMNIAGLKDFVIWRYKAMYESFIEDIILIPDGQFSQLSFEELERDRVGSIEKIYDELSLPGFNIMKPELEKYVDSISGYKKNVYSLDESDRKLVAKEWGRFIDYWGYEPGD